MDEEDLKFVLDREVWLREDLHEGKIAYGSVMMRMIDIIWKLSLKEDHKWD